MSYSKRPVEGSIKGILYPFDSHISYFLSMNVKVSSTSHNIQDIADKIIHCAQCCVCKTGIL